MFWRVTKRGIRAKLSGEMGRDGPNTTKAEAAEQRKARLAAALKANLKRRKVQARARKGPGGAERGEHPAGE